MLITSTNHSWGGIYVRIGGMVESQSNYIKVDNTKAYIFNGIEKFDSWLKLLLAILEYIYCNEIVLDEKLAMELIPQADEYLLHSLTEICENFLMNRLRKDNVINLLNMADVYGVEKLKNACLKFMIKNLSQVENNEEMLKLPKYLYLDLLKYALNKEFQANDLLAPFLNFNRLKKMMTKVWRWLLSLRSLDYFLGWVSMAKFIEIYWN